jgi:hypothetical protein
VVLSSSARCGEGHEGDRGTVDRSACSGAGDRRELQSSEVPPVVAERLARSIEKALAQVGVDGDVTVR